MKGQDIISRVNRLMSSREIIKEQWEAIERYIAPYRGRFYYDTDSEDSQEWRKPWIYDGTAIQASQNLAASLHSALTSPTARFFALSFRNKADKNNKAGQEWLEECSNRIYWALQDSNFNVQINETYQDLVNYGTSILTQEMSTDNKLIFKSIPIKECFFEEDDRGGIQSFYRVFEWTPRQMVQFFGEDLPKEIIEEADNPSTDVQKKYKIVYCIYLRLDKLDNLNSQAVLSEEERPVGYKYVLFNDGTEIGKSGGYYEMPAYVPRWRKTNGSMWGNSPAMVAISDVLTLNRLIELNLVAIEKIIDPPTITTQRGLVGDLNLTAGGITVVRSMQDIAPYESGSRFDVTYIELERLRESIRDYFFINQLILPPMEGTPATAMEISVRMQQLEKLIGPTLGRINTDILDPMITCTFRKMRRAGQLPDPPPGLTDEAELDIEYISPMAKTQEASNMAALERFSMFTANNAQLNPGVLDIPDWDEMQIKAAEFIGVPASCINSKENIETMRTERQELETMQAQGAAMQEFGKGAQEMEKAGE